MRNAKLVGVSVAVSATVLLAACGAQATMTTFVKGTWDCTSSAAGDVPLVAEVGDGSYTVKGGNVTVTGTWDASFGDLAVKIKMTDQNLSGGVLKNFPAKDKPQGSFTSTWDVTYGEQDDGPDPLAVSIDGKKVRLVYSGRDTKPTTTTCAKR